MLLYYYLVDEMEVRMSDATNKFKAARRASDMSLDRAAELAKLSKPSYISREKSPKDFRLYELEGVYNGLSETAKPIFLSAVTEIFLPS